MVQKTPVAQFGRILCTNQSSCTGFIWDENGSIWGTQYHFTPEGMVLEFFYNNKYSSFRNVSKWALTKNTKICTQYGCTGYTLNQNRSYWGTDVYLYSQTEYFLCIFCKSLFTHVPEWGIFVFIKKILWPSLPV